MSEVRLHVARRYLHTKWFWGAVLVAVIIALAFILWSDDSLVTRLFTGQDQTWAAMEQRGVWRVGLDPSFPPFEMLDEHGKPIGYDVDLAEAIAAQWGMDVEVVALGFDSLLDAVAAGKIDSAVSAMPYDPRATRDYAYSAPYFEGGVRLVVREGSTITGTDALESNSIAVEWGSMGDMVGRRLQREGIDVTLTPYETPDEAVAALVDDPEIDALLVDNVTLRQAQGAGAPIRAAGPVLESNAYVIVMPLSANTLHEQVQLSLNALHDDGSMAALEDRWFGPLVQPD